MFLIFYQEEKERNQFKKKRRHESLTSDESTIPLLLLLTIFSSSPFLFFFVPYSPDDLDQLYVGTTKIPDAYNKYEISVTFFYFIIFSVSVLFNY